MKISLRIAGRVTSINVRDSIVSLYCAIHGDTNSPMRKHIALVQDTVHSIAGTWNGNGKGLGGYITDKLIESILEDDPELIDSYRKIQTSLEANQ